MNERGPTISLRTKWEQICPCNQGWLCEQHPAEGWPHDDCAGPGMPCPRCNNISGSAERVVDGWQSKVK
jgi:hypothetical protein